MEQKKRTTAKKGAARKTGTRSGGSRSRKNTAQADPLYSILLFGLGLLLLCMAFIPGQSVWSMLRTGLFGVFGVCTYAVGPLLVYLAVLIARRQPFWTQLAKALLLMMFISGTALVFSKTQLQPDLFSAVQALYKNGTQPIGGGLLSLVFGYSLLALCGRPAANIILVILLVMGVMLFTGATPLEVWSFFAAHFGTVQRHAERTATAMAEHRAVRRAEKEVEWEQRRQEAEQQRLELEQSRIRQQQQARQFDVDLGPDAVQERKLADEPGDIVIGPGGTFGMYAASQPQPETSAVEQPPFDTAPAAPQPAEEDQPISASQPALPAQDKPLSPDPAQDNPASAELTDLIYKAVTAGEKQAVLPLEETEEEKQLMESMPRGREYQYPPIDLFRQADEPDEKGVQEEMRKNADTLVKTLDSFGVKTRILDISRGPAVTRYELQPQAGVKISKITGLADDIALNLATAGVRIEAPIPGKPAVGVEIPNSHRATVSLRSVLESPAFSQSKAPLTFALGKDITGNCQVGNLAKMPHLLIAGTTGSGKSVCTNSMILSFLYRCSPQVLRMILIDPKMVEFAHYNGIPHLLMPVVTEPRKAAGALGTAVAEMEKRYRLLADSGVPNIEEYNALAETDATLEKLPYIVIVIDELADLMMVAGKEVEDYICRLAQKARAAGMHLIIATQRPSVDVITGLIKANIPSRIALSVMSQVDSRTIIDSAGAEKLLGYGDMLYMPVGVNKPVRVQGTFVSSCEIKAVIEFIRRNSDSNYDEEMIAEMEKRATAEKNSEGSGDGAGTETDPMLKAAVEAVIDAGQASTSLLQRRCKLGYARAARIMDEMEQLKIIGPYQGAKPRQVLITRQQWIEMTMHNDPVPDEI